MKRGRFNDVSGIESALANVPLGESRHCSQPIWHAWSLSGAYYDILFLLDLFAGLLCPLLNLISQCLASLRRSKAASKSLPPGLAIRNFFVVVHYLSTLLTTTQHASWAVMNICALAQVGVTYWPLWLRSRTRTNTSPYDTKAIALGRIRSGRTCGARKFRVHWGGVGSRGCRVALVGLWSCKRPPVNFSARYSPRAVRILKGASALLLS
jgi:hypothetical protein